MSATHHSPLSRATSTRAERAADGQFDWGAQIRLGVVLSVVAVVVTVGLAGRVAEPVLVIGLLVVASVLAWRRVPAVAPAHVRKR